MYTLGTLIGCCLSSFSLGMSFSLFLFLVIVNRKQANYGI